MATTNQNRCSMCEKGAGAYFCTGCKAYFCMKDLKNHHGQLVNELDILVEDRDALQEKLNKVTRQNHSPSPLLLQIDEWQRITIEKVKQAADQARQQLTRMLDFKHSEISTSFETFSKELVRLKETEDFYHDDLTRLQQVLRQLKEDSKRLAQPSTIVLHTEQTNQLVWNHLIYVEQKSADTANKPRQQQSIEKRQTSALSSQIQLRCGGKVCLKCGNCCDWNPIDGWKRRAGATCCVSVPNEFNDLGRSGYLVGYHGFNLCQCK